jgi:hypothetical protein
VANPPPVYRPDAPRLKAPAVYVPQRAVHSGVQQKAVGKLALESRLAPQVYRLQSSVVTQQKPAANFNVRNTSASPAWKPSPFKVEPPVRRAIFPAIPGTIQRAQEIKKRVETFARKREKVYGETDFDYGMAEMVNDEEQYPGQASLDEIAAAAFSSLGSASTGAVGLLKSGTLLFASQAGTGALAAKFFGSLEGFKATTCTGADGRIPAPNIHAEMIVVYYCLTNSIDPATISAIGVKDKGCCRMCSAMLKKLGDAFTRTQDSKYEIQWVDPYDCAKKPSPLGSGSGVSASERMLL